MPEKQKAMTDAAVEAAMRMKGESVEIDGKEYIQYFESSYHAIVFVRDLTENGSPDAVRRLVQREGEPSTSFGMLLEVVGALADHDAAAAGQYLADAEQHAREIEDDDTRARALTDLASAAFKLNDNNRSSRFLDDALDVARKLPNTYISNERTDNAAAKTERLVGIALALRNIGRLSDAATVTHEAEMASRHITEDASDHLPRLCEALVSAGDYVLARQTAERATGDDKLRAFAVVMREITRKFDGEVERLLRDDEQKRKAALGD